MKIRPLNDRVLVVRLEEEEKTAGGIVIPDTAKEKPQEGKIVSAGPGKRADAGKRTPLSVKKAIKSYFPNTRELKSRLTGLNISL